MEGDGGFVTSCFDGVEVSCELVTVVELQFELVTGDGRFQRAAFDLPALLHDADLLHLYDALLHLELYDLWQRYEVDRVAFLQYLKTEGLTKLSDRQLFANALARAKRHGLYETAAKTTFDAQG